jgi:acid stress-induced BolA-like protein IbaG/YrbA
MSPEIIAQMIQLGLPGAIVEVYGDDGVHFEAQVIYDAFQGKLPKLSSNLRN